ncbi:MAG: DUF362 domain-containing protein [Candidatus Omnitrophica bacterium]|nr:DUF362 domain-containing protein [Candidatus Omnitrophota bacterium]
MQRIKVAVVRCPDYTPQTVYQAVKELFYLLGGIPKFLHAGKRIVLKPNVLGVVRPEKAVTTHPEVVRAVCRIIKEAGAYAQIGESSGCSAFNKTGEAFERSGIRKVAQELAVPLVNFDEAECNKIYLEGIEKELAFPRVLFECDSIISLPKLKTHSLTGLTGALKNMFGVIPGPRKGHLHREFADKEAFSVAMISILQRVRPQLSIMDAVYGMEGNGPAGGRPKKIGCLIASEDPVALDTIVAEKIIKLDSAYLDIIKVGDRMNAGVSRLDSIEVLGDFINDLASIKIRLPTSFYVYSHGFLPVPFKRFIMTRLFKGRPFPRITRNCVRCGKCVSVCPVHAMRMDAKSKKVRIDLKKCISCFCCNEACEYKGVSPDIPLSWKFIHL